MKTNRVISVLLLFTLALSLCVFVAADDPASLRLGDTNGNGTIEAGDALEILQYSVGKRDAFSAETASASDSSSGDERPTGGEPPVLTLASPEEFETWVTGLKQAPPEYYQDAFYDNLDEDDLWRTYYTYAQPRYQPMFALDRFYLMPAARSGWKIESVMIETVDISMKLTDGNQNHWFGYCTIHQDSSVFDRPDYTKYEYNGTTYYYEKWKDGSYDVFTMVGDYDYYVHTYIPAEQADPLDWKMVEDALAYEKIDLPPFEN